MMKKLVLMILFFLALPLVLAEQKTFTTNVNITNTGSLNGTFNVKGEGGIDRTYTCNTSFSDSISIIFNRDVKCEETELFKNFSTTCMGVIEQQKSLLSAINGTDVLVAKYSDCASDKDKYITNATIFHSDFIKCDGELTSIKGEIESLRSQSKSYESQFNTCTTTKVDVTTCLSQPANPICSQIAVNVQGESWQKYGLGALAGALIVFTIMKAQIGKRGKTPLSQGGSAAGFSMPTMKP